MCAPSPPPAPDYGQAAQAQGAANVEAAKAQGKINNPNVIGPYGKQTVTWSDDNQPTLHQELDPMGQAILNEGNNNKFQMQLLAGQGTQAAKGVIGQGVDLSDIPQAPGSAEDTRSKVISSMMGRVNEDYGKATDDANSQLIAAGIRPGSKAYDDKMQLLQRGRNDAAQQAYLGSGQEMTRDFQTDTARRKDALAEYLTKRQVPLNEITALMSGSQVNNQFATPGYAQNAQVAPAPVYGAAKDRGDWSSDMYNVGAAQAGNMQSGLFSLGGAVAGGAMMSDRRLKSNIVRIGTHPLGIGLYEYDIFGTRQQGVMADEVEAVRPEAVVTLSNGYKAVYYGRLS